ncbi:hypothetical protein EDB84DRAFT_1566972 [Lactarius hengduanensis]|nr:hypothetical protein EDB84DRAFT_1566972 [Lactarius hengduanensis]
MAQPQPNFHLIAQSFYGIAEQFHRIPNLFADLWNSIAQYTQQNQQAIDAVTARLDALEASQQQIPMHLANATASLQAPIRYPQGVQITPQFPKRKQDLLELSATNAQVVSQALGLPALHDVPLRERQQQIIDFLGCAITAYAD